MATPAIGLCWAMIHRASLSETIEIAARYGFSTLEVTPHIFSAALESGLSESGLRKQLSDAGVRVQVIDCISGGLPGLDEQPTEFRGQPMRRDTVETCLAVAEALEAPVLNLTHYRGSPVELPVLAEAIGEVCRKAGEGGRTVVLEFVPDSGIPTIAAARFLAESCGEANCTILLDTWHMARSGGTIADIEDLPPGMIGAFQLSDRTEPQPGAPYVPMSGRELPGEGELPLGPIIAAALANNPVVTIELEVFSEELLALPPEEAASRAAIAVKAWKATI
ncbi:MAG: sugar phosphate isomerase/epimerase [Novosphingobium sp.]|nr:sugar phosphate isomerase/epimerase [Novosphingobium sp.]